MGLLSNRFSVRKVSLFALGEKKRKKEKKKE